VNRAEAMADLLVKLERAAVGSAKAFVVVTVDDESGDVVHATGPFAEPEQALVQAGRDDAEWKRVAEPGEGNFTYVVVPLWEPDA
jgi:hypothetical protein